MNKYQFTIGEGSSAKTYTAKAIKPQYESIASDDSGRSDDGAMHISWIKHKVRKYEIEMPPCDYSVVNELLNLVQGQTYKFTVNDPLKNADATFTAYTSNSACDIYSGIYTNGLVQGLTFSVIDTCAEAEQ